MNDVLITAGPQASIVVSVANIGPRGPQGEQGLQGVQGPQGPQGLPGMVTSTVTPAPLAPTPAIGTSVEAARADHAHVRPTPAELGLGTAATQPISAFEPAGAVAAHVAAADPHPQYLTAAEAAAAHAPLSHTHTAAQISDSTATGRALLTAADAAAGRTTLALGSAALANTGTSGATVPLLNGANTWSGTNVFAADSAFTGAVGIGGFASTGNSLTIGRNVTGAASLSVVLNNGALQPDVTGSVNYYFGSLRTAAASFTVNTVHLFRANQGVIGAGSSVFNTIGFFADSTLIGATNNFGFRGVIPSGTGRWNLFMDGTANNAFVGNVRIGSTAPPTVALDVTGSASISGTLTIGANATSAVQAGTVTGQLASWNNTAARYEPVTLNTLPDAADDSAAATAGVAVGGLYRTGSTLKTRIA